jgi:hypothetical protein
MKYDQMPTGDTDNTKLEQNWFEEPPMIRFIDHQESESEV